MSIYDDVTNSLIAEIESNPKAWEAGITFINSIPVNIEGRKYKGINVFHLCLMKHICGYKTNQWITANKVEYLQGSIPKDQQPTIVIHFEPHHFIQSEGRFESKITQYLVYNIDQINGLPKHLYINPDKTYNWLTSDIGELLHESSECTISHKASLGLVSPACYKPMFDEIYIPEKIHFDSPENYYSTLAHEMVHSTSNPFRLNRKLGDNYLGYAFEELIAEIGACFVCAELGIQGNLENHASYLKHWLKALKSDNKFIFKASTEAQKASSYLLNNVRKFESTAYDPSNKNGCHFKR